MQKINVCHFYAGNRFGGLEKFLINLQAFRQYAPAVIQSFVLCFEGRLANCLRDEGAALWILPVKKLLLPWNLLLAWWRFYVFLRARQFDLLVCHEIWNYVLGYLPAKLSGTPIVLWSHTTSFGYRLYHLLKYLPPKYLLADSQHVMTLMHELWPSYPLDYLYYPHPDFKHLPPRQVHSDPVILYVGRMVDYKGLQVLLMALTHLRDLKFKLMIVGGPQSEGERHFVEQLKKFISDNQLQDRVEFAGEQKDVSVYYAQADIFCHPNIYAEAFGLVFIEAMYAQLPIIATDIGGAKEIFASSATPLGKLAAPNDPTALAQALRDYLTSPELRQQVQQFSKARAQDLCGPEQAMGRYQEKMLSIAKKN